MFALADGGNKLALARAAAAAAAQQRQRAFKAVPLSRLASENAGLLSSMGGNANGGGGAGPKPKLIRQSAILADGDSTSSGKSVTFKDVPPEREPEGVVVPRHVLQQLPSAQQRRLIAATAELGQCPLHTAVQLRQVYGKLAELSNAAANRGAGDEDDEVVEEESDMEASDADDDEEEEDPVSDGMPLGTTFR